MVCKTCSFNHKYLMSISPDDKEARAIRQQEKRSSSFTLATRLSRGSLMVTGKQVGRVFTVGFLTWIPQQITTFPGMLTMREQPPGSLVVVFLKGGGRLLHSCGYMAKVFPS